MDNNFFYSAAIINNNMYWSCQMGGDIQKLDLATGELNYVMPKEGLLVDELDASAVLAADGCNVYGVFHCGKYLFEYTEETNVMQTVYLGLEESRIDLVCGSKIHDGILYIVPKRSSELFMINIQSGAIKRRELLSTNRLDLDNMAFITDCGKIYIINNEFRKLLILSIKDDKYIEEYNYPEDIDIQDFFVKDEKITFIDYKGELITWDYRNGELKSLTWLPDEIRGKKDDWHVEMVMTKRSLWIVSSLRNIAVQLDLANYTAINKISNNNIIDSYMKKYYYSRNINKLINDERCYLAMVNTNSIFVIDKESDVGEFMYDVFVSDEKKSQYYCYTKKMYFEEGKMSLRDYINYLVYKEENNK